MNVTTPEDDYRNRKGRRFDLTAPEVPRSKHGSVTWPTDPVQAWMQLCDLARVAPDTRFNARELRARLLFHGETTHQATVDRIFAERP